MEIESNRNSDEGGSCNGHDGYTCGPAGDGVGTQNTEDNGYAKGGTDGYGGEGKSYSCGGSGFIGNGKGNKLIQETSKSMKIKKIAIKKGTKNKLFE